MASPAMWAALAVGILALLAGIVSLFVRLRSASGPDRHYIKWLVYAMALFILGVVVQQSGYALGFRDPALLFLLGFGLQIVAYAGLTTAVVIAIYRYHLYDIDIIINRTLVYGLLSVLLAAIYIASVIFLQQVLVPLSSQESPITIVISTLLIVSLFNPLRGRLQDFIDRRFYRSKYNAAQTLRRFAAFAQGKVDLNELSIEVLRVVEGTLQPRDAVLILKTFKKK